MLDLVVLLSGTDGGRADIKILADRLAQSIPARMKTDDVAGAVVVVIADGAPVWTGAFGLADPAAGRAMTEDALFRVESITKPLTEWGVMRLVETGQLDLDRPTADRLQRWKPPDGAAQITTRHLLTDTAGIGLGNFAARYAPDAPRPSLPEHLRQDFRMIGEPGMGFAYSDTGYNLLELVVEDCAGQDFAAFMQRVIFAPLAMRTASFDWTGAEMPVGHDLRGRPVAPYVYPGLGSGGLFATANGVARFTAVGMTGAEQEVLSRESVADLHQPVLLSLVCLASWRMVVGWDISPKPFPMGTRPSGMGAGLWLDEPYASCAGQWRRHRDPCQ